MAFWAAVDAAAGPGDWAWTPLAEAFCPVAARVQPTRAGYVNAVQVYPYSSGTLYTRAIK